MTFTRTWPIIDKESLNGVVPLVTFESEPVGQMNQVALLIATVSKFDVTA
jgi:hypothetical protein